MFNSKKKIIIKKVYNKLKKLQKYIKCYIFYTTQWNIKNIKISFNIFNYYNYKC